MKFSLVSDSVIESFTFNGHRVTAIFGQKDGPFCAPLLKLEVLEPAELKLHGTSLEILRSQTEIKRESVSLLRNGVPKLYIIAAS